jgi:hypothetical protein
MADVPIPRALRSRPRWQGYVIPYATVVDDQGRPDFRVLDYARTRECMEQQLCGLCGRPIEPGGWICFIGGPGAIKNRIFADPGMHEECARYAAAICPYLSNADGQHRPASGLPKVAGYQVVLDPLALPATARPARMAIYKCKHYDVIWEPGASIPHARPHNHPKKIDWDAMPQRAEHPRSCHESDG